MRLIEALHQIQGLFCRITEPCTGIALQLRQIVEQRRLFLFFLLFYFLQDKRIPFCFFCDLLCLFRIRNPCPARFFVLPGVYCAACCCHYGVVRLRDKFSDFLLALCNHGERRCLHTAAGKLCIVFACQCPRCVNANKPVRLCTGNSSPVEIIVLFRIFQAGKSLTDCLVGNGRNPETLARLLIVRLVKNPPRHQLAFTAGICRNDHLTDIFPRKLCRHSVILFSRLRNDLDLQFLRHHRQNCHIPFLILFIIVLRVF